MHHHHHAMK